MDMKSLLSSFFGEYEGKALQKQGEVSKDQIIQFFNHGRQLFADQEFKLGLAMAHRHRRDVQRFVDQAQAKIWEQKVNPAVQGDYGITCLSRIRQRFQNDAEVLRMFYEFVHLEEKILDEAEMPGEVFKQKYESLYAIKKAMEERMEEYKAELDNLPPQERDRNIAQIFKAMVDQAPGGSNCGNQGCSSCPPPMAMPNLPARPTTLPPTPIDGPTAHPTDGASCGNDRGADAGHRVMLSEEEQLAFFKNMQRS
ncbi:hypothetical protein DUNSADRAFT_2539 [Dunaliella salina]|uniref:Uncharacterized protein n=1 Tax=Dunaliella salina TaxID=3046 RepID=A0ABQ7FW70_DUNSA|nr:hypothetical protein DUNSADRAFT_2539 [Dunaliella salina]|eukprot:KAF5826619.1 hypothetical protein DUNSADRAFT_2539 [Dunaliella salina]